VTEVLRQLVEAVGPGPGGRNAVREYLQARLLESLRRGGAMVPLTFHGGTALRFLSAVPRYSEGRGLPQPGEHQTGGTSDGRASQPGSPPVDGWGR